jgi:hypothetical protein
MASTLQIAVITEYKQHLLFDNPHRRATELHYEQNKKTPNAWHVYIKLA